MKKTLIFLSIPFLLFSCKNSKKNTLIGKWRAVKMVNPQMDIVMKQGQQFIDTVGKSTDTAANMELYGTSNIDSLRQALQVQKDSLLKMQDDAVKNTVFDFKKDGLAILSFGGKSDSSKWSIENDSVLVLKNKEVANNIKMHIVELSDTALQLQFMEGNANSTVTFHPEGK